MYIQRGNGEPVPQSRVAQKRNIVDLTWWPYDWKLKAYRIESVGEMRCRELARMKGCHFLVVAISTLPEFKFGVLRT